VAQLRLCWFLLSVVEFSDGYYASLDDCFASPIDLDVKHFEINRIGSRDTMSMDDVDALVSWCGGGFGGI
jgi:hypothetical protein